MDLRLAQGRTILVIAHRLSTVRGSGQVIVLAEGRVAQSGAPEALARQLGLYQELLRAAWNNPHYSKFRPVSTNTISAPIAAIMGVESELSVFYVFIRVPNPTLAKPPRSLSI